MASAVVMMLGGAVVNAFAFSGSNYLFSHIGKDADKERERHDKAMEQLEATQVKWSKERTQRLDFINELLQKEHHAVQKFDDVDQAMKQYYYITGKDLQALCCCVEVLRPSQPNGVMSSAVSLPNHTFTGQA